jgi:hypothetical protein
VLGCKIVAPIWLPLLGLGTYVCGIIPQSLKRMLPQTIQIRTANLYWFCAVKKELKKNTGHLPCVLF